MTTSLTPRPATADDYEHFARLFPELRTNDDLPDRSRFEQRFAAETIMFEEHGAVVAYANVQVLHGVGYVHQIVVDPARQGSGVGRAVMDYIAGRLRAAGCSRWCLNVKPENEPAVRLYRRVGMEVAYFSRAIRIGWDIVHRLPRGERAVLGRLVEPGEEAALEAAFDISEGLLAGARAKPGIVLLRLVDPAAPSDPRVGVAHFDPTFPGAFPFRVAHPTLASPLIDAIRPYAPADPPYIQVVIEGDDALSQTLLDAGATERLAFLHMRGPL